jgi:hypothetical protein
MRGLGVCKGCLKGGWEIEIYMGVCERCCVNVSVSKVRCEGVKGAVGGCQRCA